ncbi:MAG: DoxX family protein [Terriglobales bacterium]
MSAVVRAIKKCYLAEVQFLNRLQPVLLLLLRLYIGYGFFKSGWGKLQNISTTAEYFSGLNIPLPALNAYLAGATECFGGLLLLLGVASRVVTIPLIFTMIIAYSTQHIDELRTLWTVPPGKNFNPAAFFKAAPFLYLLTSLLVLLFGPGIFSIDGLLKSYFNKKGNGERL